MPGTNKKKISQNYFENFKHFEKQPGTSGRRGKGVLPFSSTSPKRKEDGWGMNEYSVPINFNKKKRKKKRKNTKLNNKKISE
jgi:hypothetical protein